MFQFLVYSFYQATMVTDSICCHFGSSVSCLPHLTPRCSRPPCFPPLAAQPGGIFGCAARVHTHAGPESCVLGGSQFARLVMGSLEPNHTGSAWGTLCGCLAPLLATGEPRSGGSSARTSSLPRCTVLVNSKSQSLLSVFRRLNLGGDYIRL